MKAKTKIDFSIKRKDLSAQKIEADTTVDIIELNEDTSIVDFGSDYIKTEIYTKFLILC
jgi:hypothetical protein